MIWKKWTLNTLLQFYYIIYQYICSLFHVHQINHRKRALYQHLLKKKNQTTLLTLKRLSSNISQILGNSYACPKLVCSFSQQIIPPDANYLASCFTDGKQIYNENFTFPETKRNFQTSPQSENQQCTLGLHRSAIPTHLGVIGLWILKKGGSGTP